MLPHEQLRAALVPAYSPCPGFDTACKGKMQWARVLGRVITHADSDRSPFVRTTQAERIDVRFDKKVPYELDGGARGKTDRLKIRVRPQAVIVCVPEAAEAVVLA